MARLGPRQIAALKSAAAGTARTHHSGQGRMDLFAIGVDPERTEHLLDRLLELEYVTLGERLISGHKLVITEDGIAALMSVGVDVT